MFMYGPPVTHFIIEYAGGEHKHRESPGEEFPGFEQVFPVLSSPKDALWVQYSCFDADASVERKAAWELLAKLEQYI